LKREAAESDLPYTRYLAAEAVGGFYFYEIRLHNAVQTVWPSSSDRTTSDLLFHNFVIE
jgi:hypothetical protein